VATPIAKVQRLISELETLTTGEATVASLIAMGPVAIEPLRLYLLEGKPSSVFQPRLWAVKALAGLQAREALVAYLLQKRKLLIPRSASVKRPYPAPQPGPWPPGRMEICAAFSWSSRNIVFSTD
jgi:hypothetical protein